MVLEGLPAEFHVQRQAHSILHLLIHTFVDPQIQGYAGTRRGAEKEVINLTNLQNVERETYLFKL